MLRGTTRKVPDFVAAWRMPQLEPTERYWSSTLRLMKRGEAMATAEARPRIWPATVDAYQRARGELMREVAAD